VHSHSRPTRRGRSDGLRFIAYYNIDMKSLNVTVFYVVGSVDCLVFSTGRIKWAHKSAKTDWLHVA